LTDVTHQSPGPTNRANGNVNANEQGGAQPGNTPGIYSGYGKKATWNIANVALIETFNEKNSFIGKGVTDNSSSQLGFTIKSPFGTTIQPYIAYQYSSIDLFGANSAHGDTYGASLNIAQKLLPAIPVFRDNQSGAVLNIPADKPDVPCDKNTWKDHYPNFDVVAGLNLSYGDANISTYKKGWAYDTQDGYGIRKATWIFYPMP
jgi:hypothetical protein